MTKAGDRQVRKPAILATVVTVAHPRIVLASASPRRVELLRAAGLRFDIVPPAGVEEITGGLPPDVLAIRNAERKADAVAAQQTDAIVIAADTVVALGTETFGKPRDLDEAGRMLARLAGQLHEVLTGVCVVHRPFDTHLSFCERTRVWMQPLTGDQIRDYFTKMDPLDKAGAYAIQEHGAGIIERIDGSYSNVVGLPVERLMATLQRIGVPPA